MWALCAMESNWTSKIKHMYVFPVTQQFYFKIYTKQKCTNVFSKGMCKNDDGSTVHKSQNLETTYMHHLKYNCVNCGIVIPQNTLKP